MLTVDYVFIEDLSWLIINIDVRYPVFEPGTVIDGYAPIEVPVFACAEEDGIDVIEHYPDGESAAFKLTPAAGECSISGKGFTFRKGANVVSLWLPDAEGETIETLTAVFKRRKKAYAFCIQPRGENTDVRTEELSGLEESFCLALIPREESFPYTLLKEPRIVNEIFRSNSLVGTGNSQKGDLSAVEAHRLPFVIRQNDERSIRIQAENLSSSLYGSIRQTAQK